MSSRAELRRVHTPPVMPGDFWDLPAGWTWCITRVIHCLPEDQLDGWRVQLVFRNQNVIEVTHHDVEHARAIALEAAGETWPASFKEWVP